MRNTLKKLYLKFFGNLIDAYYRKYEADLRSRLKVHDFTIISSNCMGGCIYHRLGERFNSPTINLFIRNDQFVRFAANIEYYLNMDLEYVDTEYDYQVGRLDDVLIYFNHYKTKVEAASKWNERKKRVNYDNLYILLPGEDGISEDDFQIFGKINCRNKLIIVDKKHCELDYTLSIKPHKHRTDGLRYIDRILPHGWYFERKFDYVKWLNDGEV